MMEEFRSSISDTLTISLFNLKILQKKDFQIKFPKTDKIVDQHLPDVSKDSIGMIMMQDSNTECFDMPEQRMETDQKLPRHHSGGYPVKLKNDAFGRVIDAFEKK